MANRMTLTCTVQDIKKKKMSDSGVTVSLGKVMGLNPFFITYPTDKELALCLCNSVLM